MATFRLGKDMILNLAVGGVTGTPSWIEMANVRDLTLSMEADRADLSTRGSGGWRQEVATLRSATISFSIVWDTGDAGFEALKDAFLTSDIIGVQCLDGPEAGTPPGQGLQSDMVVFNFTRNEELTEGVTVDVELGIAYGAVPEWLPTGVVREGDEAEGGTAKSKRRAAKRDAA